MCRPVGGSREEACPGGHTGPPLRGVGSVQRSTEIGMKRRLVQRGGAEPAPYRGSGAGGCVQDGGVWSPRPMGATLVGRSSGPMYLRHGFRRPNFVPKFGASVMVIGPYVLRGDGGRHVGVVVPYGWLRRAAAIALASGAQRSVCARGREEIGGKRSRNHPRRGHQRRTIPQSRLRRASSLCTREPFPAGDGGIGRGMRIAASLRSSQ